MCSCESVVCYTHEHTDMRSIPTSYDRVKRYGRTSLASNRPMSYDRINRYDRFVTCSCPLLPKYSFFSLYATNN